MDLPEATVFSMLLQCFEHLHQLSLACICLCTKYNACMQRLMRFLCKYVGNVANNITVVPIS